MTELLIRRCELRLDAGGEARRVFGRVVPYGVEADVSDHGGARYRERFAFGAFARSITERGHKVKLLANHDDRRLPIGRATRLEEQPDGLHGEFMIAATRAGDDVLALLRDGIVDSFSVGFRPIRSSRDGAVTVRTEAALREVSLVAFPAYDTAVVAGVRHDPHRSLSAAAARRRLDLLTRGTP